MKAGSLIDSRFDKLVGEGLATLQIGGLLEEVRTSLDEQRQGRLVIDCAAREAMVTVPRRSVKRVVRGLIPN